MIKMNPSKFFIYCALIFGILLIALIPPFQSPDEDSHFKKAYVVSTGRLYPTSENGIIGYSLPTDMIDYINKKLEFIGNTEQKYSYRELVLDERLPKDYGEKTFQNFSTAEVTPIVYAAPALGIVFSKIMNFIIGVKNPSIVNMLYFARFFSLLLYVCVIAVSIRITPILKKTFCFIGLLPMALTLAVCISYDSVLIATCMLATAIIFKLIFDDSIKKVNYKYIIALGVIGFILLSLKTVYITVLIPLLFVPKEKYGEGLKGIVKVLALIAGIAIAIYVLNKLPTLFLDKAQNIEHESFKQQISFIISHPIDYLKIWITTMIDNRNFYITGMIGTFGLIDTYLVSAYTSMYIIAFLIIVIADTSLSDKKFDWRYKICSVLGIFASVFAIFASLYVVWTSIIDGYGVGASSITGVQGRYFIPLIPLAIVLFSNSILTKNQKIKQILVKILDNTYIVSFIMLIISSIAILLRFWC